MKKNNLIAALLSALFFLVVYANLSSAGEVQSLRKTKEVLNDSIVPKVAQWPKEVAGTSKVLPRAYDKAPPNISHSLEGMMINKATNSCLTCHEKTVAVAAKFPAMPVSHYTSVKGKEQNEYYKGRYYCNVCHTPLSDAKPLVKNSF